MKYKIIVGVFVFLIVGVLCNISSVHAKTVELVKNGDFEQQKLYWSGNTGNIIYDSKGGMNGTYFAYMGFDDFNDIIVQQDIALPANATNIKLKFDYKYWSNISGGSIGGFGVVAIHGANDVVLDAEFFEPSDDTGMDMWYVERDITEFKGKTIHLASATHNEGGYSNRLLVDNFTITATVPNSLYRFWSKKNKSHFYTASEAEKDYIIANYDDYVWKYEGVANDVFATQVPNSTPIYRFWSKKHKGHFYTGSLTEKNYIMASYDDYIWKYEGIAYYAYPTQQLNTKPVYRFWSTKNKHHFYTASETEKDYVIAHYDDYVWKYEGKAWYVVE